MLLMAGLVGLFISGVLVALPMPGDETGADPAEHDLLREEVEEPLPASLLEAEEAQDTAAAPAAPEPHVLPQETGDTAPLADLENELSMTARDQVGGDHLTDRINGSSALPIAVDGEAQLGNGSGDQLAGTETNDMIEGNDGDDTLRGNAGRDILIGGRGDDQLEGGAGDDLLHGDDGDDTLAGNGGDDLLSGGAGADQLAGGDGDDRLIGGEGRDTLDGGAGDDVLDGSVLNAQGAEADSADELYGGEGRDTLAGGSGDTLTGGSQADLFLFRAPSAAALGVAGELDEIPLITDFDPTEDVIEIDFSGPEAPEVRLVEVDGETRILLDDIAVVRLTGAPGVESSHIQLISIP